MALIKKIQISVLILGLVLSSFSLTYAQSTDGVPISGSFTQQLLGTQETSNSQIWPTLNQNQGFITRGEAVHDVLQTFNLRQTQASFITSCLNHLDECFFVFSAMTRYDQMSLHPLQLYPDVPPTYIYADDINVATMLNLVHGNIQAKKSPFNPRAYITRINALKIVLAAANLLQWREKFELVRDLGNEDVLRSQTSEFADVNALGDNTWWYPRYVNFALSVGIIDPGKYFRPDEPITYQAYQTMLDRALKQSLELHDSQNQSPGNSSQQTVD